jgi:arsenite methyltransferase
MQEQAIKEKVKERYGKIALTTNPESCSAPTCDSSEVISAVQIAKNIGYDAKDLEAVPGSI